MKRGKFESQPVAKKNNGKKIVSLLLVLVLLLGAVVGTTLAWLVDKPDSITNTFVVGNVDIDLTEDEGSVVAGVKQFKMTPGATVDKDPTVTVDAESEPCYVFVKIEEANNTFTPVGGSATTIVDYDIATGWHELSAGVYYREWNAPVVAGKDDKFSVFANNEVTITNKLDKAYMDEVAAAPTTAPSLTITAYAIQSADLTEAAGETGIDANDAWALLNAQLNPPAQG